MSQFSVPLATIDDFADRTGAERVVALLDRGDAAPPVLLERLEDGTLQVTEDADPVGVARDPAALPVALGDLRTVPASALSADPEAGELAAPIGSVQLLADSVLALARALGGRSVATATFATRDEDMPLTVAAREGEPVVLDIAGRQFSMPV
ncbi:MAG: hypothetical protein ACAH82_04885 [Solirubrobacteraceae bacterium]